MCVRLHASQERAYHIIGVLLKGLHAHYFAHVKISLRAHCIYAHHHVRNLPSPDEGTEAVKELLNNQSNKSVATLGFKLSSSKCIEEN